MGLFDSISLNENEGGRLLKRASVVAKARYDARFASFVDSASSAEERKQRFDMVSDGVRELAEVVASEQGVDANIVFNKIAVDVIGDKELAQLPMGPAPDGGNPGDDADEYEKVKQIAEVLGIDPAKVDLKALRAAIEDFDKENPVSDEDAADAELPPPHHGRPPQGEMNWLSRRSDAVHDSVFSVLAAEFGDTSTMERVDVSTGDGPIPEINLSPVGDGLSPIEVPSVANPTEQIGVTDEIVAENAADDIVPTTQTERVDIENAPAEQTGDGTSVFPAGNQAQPVTTSKWKVAGDFGPDDDPILGPRNYQPHPEPVRDNSSGLIQVMKTLKAQGYNEGQAMVAIMREGYSREEARRAVSLYWPADDADVAAANDRAWDSASDLSHGDYGPAVDGRMAAYDFDPERVDEANHDVAQATREKPEIYVKDLFQQGLTYPGVVNYLIDFLGFDRAEAEQLVAQYAPTDHVASYGDYAPSGGWDHQPSVHDRAVELARKGMTADEIRQRLGEEFDDEDPDEIDYAIGAALRANEPRPMESDPRY